MKRLHKPNLWCWSSFDEDRNIDFNSYLWVREGGNVAIDPLPLSEHDRAHIDALGGVAMIVVTNSDHLRATAALVDHSKAKVAGPAAEREAFDFPCDVWLADGDDELDDVEIIAMAGSKTPGELALLIEGDTLVTGDLVRGQHGGVLNLLPEAKLRDGAAARASVLRLVEREQIEAVLVGDGWPIFRDGHAALRALVQGFG